jgi:GMP synthase-like glutamine amidotransferase
MILVVDLSYRPGSLSLDEFVAPVGQITRHEGYPIRIRYYSHLSREDIASADGAILCGTAMKDFGYLEEIERFAWLLSFPCPVLGICAGMQVLVRAYGGDVHRKTGIGMAEQQVVAPDPLLAGRERFPAYELHCLSVEPPPSFRVLATSVSGAQIIRHRERPVYGVMFHPEVRNEWLIRRFLSLCGPRKGQSDDLM